jgi:hypothetical protein
MTSRSWRRVYGSRQSSSEKRRACKTPFVSELLRPGPTMLPLGQATEATYTRPNRSRGNDISRGLLILVVLMTLALVSTAFAALPEQPVLTGVRNEQTPAAGNTGSEDVLAWARSRSGHPHLFDAWVRVGTSPATKLNTAGQGWMGGVDYPRVIYQQVRNGRSNLFLYDLSDGSRPATPTGVNTAKWEWHPTISGDWLLFGRTNNSTPTDRVILHNQTTSEERLLATVTRRTHSLVPDQVNGNWATYTRCAPVCNVIRYDITSQTKKKLGKPAATKPRYQYGSSVAADGTVYLARSGRGCGTGGVKLVRFGALDTATGTVVARLATDFDFFFSSVRDNADGSTDVFYDRVRCATGRWDIYKITDGP